MKYRKLGSSELIVSEIAFGSWLTFSTAEQKKSAIACVHRALDRGITLIDTANVYGRGAAERVVPILMTALVTALGLLPLALGTGEPGREIEGPMAIVILGGLITSTLLNLLVLPTLALRYGRFNAAKN